ncbi:hypothetical protein [Spirulina sp. 06S082]|nr:hypothetical protein [Spirulina sp. 06S082]MEA5469068.1 hypothetical protein [Spirulina sp. 06S082]
MNNKQCDRPNSGEQKKRSHWGKWKCDRFFKNVLLGWRGNENCFSTNLIL